MPISKLLTTLLLVVQIELWRQLVSVSIYHHLMVAARSASEFQNHYFLSELDYLVTYNYQTFIAKIHRSATVISRCFCRTVNWMEITVMKL